MPPVIGIGPASHTCYLLHGAFMQALPVASTRQGSQCTTAITMSRRAGLLALGAPTHDNKVKSLELLPVCLLLLANWCGSPTNGMRLEVRARLSLPDEGRSKCKWDVEGGRGCCGGNSAPKASFLSRKPKPGGGHGHAQNVEASHAASCRAAGCKQHPASRPAARRSSAPEPSGPCAHFLGP